MDKPPTLEEEPAGNRVPENDSVEMQPDDEEMEETTGVPPSTSAEADRADEQHPESRVADATPEGENRCAVCGFSAKQPRSLKIHYARKHIKTPKPHEQSQNNQVVSPAERRQEAIVETANPNKRPSPEAANSSDVISFTKKQKVSDEQQTDADEPAFVQERRVSKRTPKPKMIYSCNYCGQEFRDKSPLDVHVLRYHTKDVPLTCEYFLFFKLCSFPSVLMLAQLLFYTV